jgi:hypothetical protein
VLDHYLEVLSRKPGAFGGSTALTAAAPPGCSPLIINGSGRRLGGGLGRARHPGPERTPDGTNSAYLWKPVVAAIPKASLRALAVTPGSAHGHPLACWPRHAPC